MSTTSNRRRDYGSHSIYQRKSDHRRLAAIDVGWSQDGTRRRITVSAKTEAAVKVKLRQKLKALEEAGDSGASSRTTVKQWTAERRVARRRRARPAPGVVRHDQVGGREVDHPHHRPPALRPTRPARRPRRR